MSKGLKIFIIYIFLYLGIFAFVVSPKTNAITDISLHPGEVWNYWVENTWNNASTTDDLYVGWDKVQEDWYKKTWINLDWDTAYSVAMRDSNGGAFIRPDLFKSYLTQYMINEWDKYLIPCMLIGAIPIVIGCALFGKNGFSVSKTLNIGNKSSSYESEREARRYAQNRYNASTAKDKYESAKYNRNADEILIKSMGGSDRDARRYAQSKYEASISNDQSVSNINNRNADEIFARVKKDN